MWHEPRPNYEKVIGQYGQKLYGTVFNYQDPVMKGLLNTEVQHSTAIASQVRGPLAVV